jgi:hypothetical protein
MRYRLMAALLIAVAGVAVAKQALLTDVPLLWKPTSDLRLGTMQMPQNISVHFETFTDQREDHQSIGQNMEDEGKPKPVTTKDDVGAFVSAHMSQLFKQAGLAVVESGATATIKGEVTQFFVRETNTYRSEVQVHVTVIGPTGATLWSGIAPGDATRFGRSYKLENYYETLSDAVVNATSSMLQSSEFQKALAGR